MTRRSLIGMLLLAAATPWALATDCWLRCDGASVCTVARPQAAAVEVPSRFTTPNVPCATLGALERGERIEGLVRQRGKVEVFAVAPRQDVGATFRKFGGSGDCAFADRACRERRDQAMIAGRAGKAFDGPSGHQPTGTPCALGLPCGVVLAPAQPWSLHIDDARAAEGILQIAALRNAAGSVDVPVRDGRVTLAPGFVRAGASYSYALKERTGAVIAAGQFSAADAAIEADVQRAEDAARLAGQSAASARLKALLQEELDWDAMQLTRR